MTDKNKNNAAFVAQARARIAVAICVMILPIAICAGMFVLTSADSDLHFVVGFVGFLLLACLARLIVMYINPVQAAANLNKPAAQQEWVEPESEALSAFAPPGSVGDPFSLDYTFRDDW